jgi:hypothetical protein
VPTLGPWTVIVSSLSQSRTLQLLSQCRWSTTQNITPFACHWVSSPCCDLRRHNAALIAVSCLTCLAPVSQLVTQVFRSQAFRSNVCNARCCFVFAVFPQRRLYCATEVTHVHRFQHVVLISRKLRWKGHTLETMEMISCKWLSLHLIFFYCSSWN